MGFLVAAATQKALYGYEPDDPDNAVDDLAEGAPEISADGKTVTVKIKKGVKFSPPVDREVTSKDVKYAIERGFFNTINNGYAGAYFGDIVGAKVAVKPGTDDRRHRDAGRPDAGVQAQAAGGRRPGRRDGAAADRSGAGGVRQEVRRQEPVDLR